MTFDIDSDGILDNTPLKFGKFRGKTPSHVAEKEYRGEGWLVWAYETVGNFDVCSATLYKDCGGKGTRAKGTASVANPAYARSQSSSPYSGKSIAGDQGEDEDDIPF